MDQSEFPDLDVGAAASGNSNAPTQSKADGAMMFTGGASATSGAATEERKVPTKPVFRGKANFGGATNEEV